MYEPIKLIFSLVTIEDEPALDLRVEANDEGGSEHDQLLR